MLNYNIETLEYNQKIFRIIISVTLLFNFILRLILSNFIELKIQAILYVLPIAILILCNLDNIKLMNFNLILTLLLLQVCGLLYKSIDINEFFSFIIYIFTPLMIFTIGYDNEKFYKIFKDFIKIFNAMIYIGLIFSIIDFLLKGILQLSLATWMPRSSFISQTILNEHSYGIYRAHGILGHSLTSSLLYILYLSLNMIKIHYFNHGDSKVFKVIIIGTLGLILSNSKLGLILGAIMICINIKNVKGINSKFIFIFFIFIGMILIINTGYIKDNVLPRFLQVIELGDITNGRVGAFKSFIEHGYKFNLLFGNGMGSSDYVMAYIGTNNLEFPMFMWAYDYGILSTIIIYIFLLIYPIYIFIKNQTYYMAMLYIIVFLAGNSFNALATGTGMIQIYVLFLYIILNLSRFIRYKRREI